MAHFVFNTNRNLPAEKPVFDVLPNAEYLVQVDESKIKATRAGDALELTLKVLDGPYRNRKVWTTFYLNHEDRSVRDRATRELNNLCLAVNVEELQSTEVLHDKPFIAYIYLSPAKDGYKAKNAARNFKPANHLYPPEYQPDVPGVSPLKVPDAKQLESMEARVHRIIMESRNRRAVGPDA